LLESFNLEATHCLFRRNAWLVFLLYGAFKKYQNRSDRPPIYKETLSEIVGALGGLFPFSNPRYSELKNRFLFFLIHGTFHHLPECRKDFSIIFFNNKKFDSDM